MTPSLLHIFALALAAPSSGSDSSLVPADSLADPVVAALVEPPVREARLEGGEVVGARGRDVSPVRVFARQEIERSSSLVDMLSREPGVVGRRAGGLGHYATLSMRGSSSEQVEVWMDGVPLGGSAGSSVDLGPMALDGLERVELRQAGQTGSNGAPRLDLVSRRGWARTGGSLRLGSFGERAMAAWWGDRSGRVTVTGWLESAENDYPFPWDNGTAYNTADDRTERLANNDYTGRGIAAALRPTESLDATLRVQDARRGVSIPGLDDPRGRLEDASIQASARWRSSVEPGPSAELSGLWRRSTWEDPGSTTGWQVEEESREKAMDLSARAGLERTRGGWLDGWLSAHARWESSLRESLGDRDVPVTPQADRRTLEAELGWRGTAASGTFGAEASARGQSFVDGRDWTAGIGTLETGPRQESSRRGSRLQGRLWTRPARPLALWVSSASRVRPPDFQEWMGDNGYTLGTPRLAVERSFAHEAGARFQAATWSAATTAWWSRYDDPIEAYQLGSSPLVYHRNAPGYSARGLDLRLDLCGELAGASLSGGLQEAAIDDPNPSLDGNLPRRFPTWKADLQLSAGPWKGFRLGGGGQVQGPSFASELNRPADERPARVFLDTWARWSARGFTASATARNLLDQHPEDLEDIPLAGRQYAARLEYEIPSSNQRTTGAPR